MKLLKTPCLLLFLLAASPPPAYSWDVLPIPSLKEQYEYAKIEEMIRIFETEPYFAGKLVQIDAFGKRIAVDRRGENSPHPGGPPPNSGIGALTEFLNGLDIAAKADLEIGVSRQWYETGILKEEKWNVVIHGSYHVTKEELKPDKEDKKTGEAE